MTLSKEEVEILMLENARRTADEHVARCQRRICSARIELEAAVSAVQRLDDQILAKRDAYLMRTV